MVNLGILLLLSTGLAFGLVGNLTGKLPVVGIGAGFALIGFTPLAIKRIVRGESV